MNELKVVSTRTEFLAMFDKDGVPIVPFSVQAGVALTHLTGVTSLVGVEFQPSTALFGLSSITSLDGVVLKEGVWLFDLDNVVVQPINPTDDELDILRRIPLDNLDMSAWHCGTAHCLAGWAQVLSGLPEDEDTALVDGRRVLPSMIPYFHCADKQVLTYLRTLHK